MNFEVGRKYVTRDGRVARVLATDLKTESDMTLALVLTHPCGYEELRLHMANGRIYARYDSAVDLVAEYREPAVAKGWVNVYKDSVDFFYTKQDADNWATLARIACVYVSGTEGVEP